MAQETGRLDGRGYALRNARSRNQANDDAETDRFFAYLLWKC